MVKAEARSKDLPLVIMWMGHGGGKREGVSKNRWGNPVQGKEKKGPSLGGRGEFQSSILGPCTLLTWPWAEKGIQFLCWKSIWIERRWPIRDNAGREGTVGMSVYCGPPRHKL